MLDLKTVNEYIKVQQLGPFIVDKKHAINSYYIDMPEFKIIIDINPIQVLDLQKLAIKKFIEINEITHIVIQNMTMSTINSLIDLIDEGFAGYLITNEFIARQIFNASLGLRIITIEQLNYKIVKNQKTVISFIPMAFLPFPEMFMTYIFNQGILFSSTLFSSFYDLKAIPSIDHIKKSIFDYHKYMMPSSEYVRQAFKQIRKYELNQIYPLMGYMITKQILPDIIEFEEKLDFFNTYSVFKYDENQEKEVNYLEIINHMLLILQKHYPKIEILNLFIGTTLNLNPETLEVKTSSTDGYKIWNAFFDQIFVKKGLSWLSILEPLVNGYVSNYHIMMPSIYRSKMIELTNEKENLKLIKNELEDRLANLNLQLDQTKETMLKCPITKLYIENVLREMMRVDFTKPLENNLTRGFILIQLDQLQLLNKRYGKETGDEAIRNMAYQLQQIKKTDSLIYKQNGPGLIIYEDHTTLEQVEKCAVMARNAINESNLFIEKVSASISLVTFDEIDQMKTIDEQIKDVFSLLDERMQAAKNTGQSEIIDKNKKIRKNAEGIVLLVDEDEVNRNMLYRIFTRINYEVAVASSVSEALTIIKSNQIDIIISEINLSKLDGFQLKLSLNETKEYSHIPFIMVSHNKTLENIKRGNTLDVDLILEKPIIPEELIGHVKRFKDKKLIK
jgi:diguanylate cyclase (GGDEF)-like protein